MEFKKIDHQSQKCWVQCRLKYQNYPVTLLGSSPLYKTLSFRDFEMIHGETLRSLTITIAKFTRLSLALFSIYYIYGHQFRLITLDTGI